MAPPLFFGTRDTRFPDTMAGYGFGPEWNFFMGRDVPWGGTNPPAPTPTPPPITQAPTPEAIDQRERGQGDSGGYAGVDFNDPDLAASIGLADPNSTTALGPNSSDALSGVLGALGQLASPIGIGMGITGALQAAGVTGVTAAPEISHAPPGSVVGQAHQAAINAANEKNKDLNLSVEDGLMAVAAGILGPGIMGMFSGNEKATSTTGPSTTGNVNTGMDLSTALGAMADPSGGGSSGGMGSMSPGDMAGLGAVGSGNIGRDLDPQGTLGAIAGGAEGGGSGGGGGPSGGGGAPQGGVGGDHAGQAGYRKGGKVSKTKKYNLHKGEYVLRPEAAQALGKPVLDMLNKMTIKDVPAVLTKMLAATAPEKFGRGGDSMMAHMTPGEVVVPKKALTPALVAHIEKSMLDVGADPRQYVAGASMPTRNPVTGKQEFFFKDFLKIIAPVAGGAIGGFAGDALGIGAGWGQAIGSGLGAFAGGSGSLLDRGIAGLFAGIGSAAGGSIADQKLDWGNIGDIGFGANGMTWDRLFGGAMGSLLGAALVDSGMNSQPTSSQQMYKPNEVNYDEITPWFMRRQQNPNVNVDTNYGYAPEQGFFF